VPAFKPAYLICGDDHGRIAERRARLRALAEAEAGVGGVEILEGDGSTPEAAATSLSTMTLTVGRRFVIVDGVERWREADVEAALVGGLATIPPDVTIAFFAREEGRAKTPAALRKAVLEAGGDVSEEVSLREWKLPQWVQEQAHRLGIELDAGAARALVTQVGDRQQRLLRELEKLAIELPPGTRIGAEDLEHRTARSAERRAWSLGDALLAGDAAAATRLYLRLRTQGERVESLTYSMTKRLREAVRVANRLAAGEPASEVKRSLRMPPKAAERFIADVRGREPARLQADVVALADLELGARGGCELEADTQSLATIRRVAGR
jgi:DNA polymerase-3 subunit delta